MQLPGSLLFRLYRRAITFYPPPFRQAYGDQTFITAENLYGEAQCDGHVCRFWLRIGCDLLISLCREHALYLKRQVIKQPIIFHTIGLVLVLTLLGGVAAVTTQQMLRRGADQPQLQMVERYSRKISDGAAPAAVIPVGHIDVAESLEPFLIFYNDGFEPLTSDAFLGSQPPVPPLGVFQQTRLHGSIRLTWQPRPGVRIAMVTRRIDGPHPGFLLAGRSLRVVEEYESDLYRMTMIGWVLVVALLAGGATLLSRTRSVAP